MNEMEQSGGFSLPLQFKCFSVHVMGSQGVCTQDDILRAMENTHQFKLHALDFGPFIDPLIDGGLVQAHDVPSLRTPRAWVYELTRKGRNLYQYLFSDPIVTPVIREILHGRENDLGLGYFIKETIELLSELGYTGITFDPEFNLVKIGRRKLVIDLRAKATNGKDVLITFYRANETRKSLWEKLDVLGNLSPELHFITADQSGLAKLRQDMTQWYFSQLERGETHESLPKFYVTSFGNLATGKTFGQPFDLKTIGELVTGD